MTLTPAFDSDVTEYSATTSNATNTVTVTTEDEGATVVITCNGETYESGDPVTWVVGENELVIAVTSGSASMEYTVVVTKGE